MLFPVLVSLMALAQPAPVSSPRSTLPHSPRVLRLRVATYNTSLHRDEPAALIADLKANAKQASQIAEALQRVRPDIVLLNEFDHDAIGEAARLFQQKYLSKAQHPSLQPLAFAHSFCLPVNTGVPSGFDLNKDGELGGPSDAWGFGRHPGQYGMLLLSRFAIDRQRARTFQKFRWSKMPGALVPQVDGVPYYPNDIWKTLRLSSKSHWDVPILLNEAEDDGVAGERAMTLHILASHPTPPVFDGPEDRNGRRNHDEIRLWADYISGGKRAAYVEDDAGVRGGMEPEGAFVILGDLNADPQQGDSVPGAIAQLLKHPRINAGSTPQSKLFGSSTADFGRGRRYRVDYVLPSSNLKVVRSGVYWPGSSTPGAEVVEASDHRLVWIDLQLVTRVGG